MYNYIVSFFYLLDFKKRFGAVVYYSSSKVTSFKDPAVIGFINRKYHINNNSLVITRYQSFKKGN